MLNEESDPIAAFRSWVQGRTFDTPWGDRRCESIDASRVPDADRVFVTLRFDDGRQVKLTASAYGLGADPDNSHRNKALICIRGWLNTEDPESDEIDLLSGSGQQEK